MKQLLAGVDTGAAAGELEQAAKTQKESESYLNHNKFYYRFIFIILPQFRIWSTICPSCKTNDFLSPFGGLPVMGNHDDAAAFFIKLTE